MNIPNDIWSSVSQIMANPQFAGVIKSAQNINWNFEIVIDFTALVEFLQTNKNKILPIQIIKEESKFLVLYYQR